MRTKILTLGLICLFVFAYCNSPADPEIEKVLNPGNPGTTENDLPVILYFYEEHEGAGRHNLFWSVAETPAATVTTSWGSSGELTGGSTVWVSETTTYTLTATNAAGSTIASLVIEPKKRAVLEVTTIPDIPIFHYVDIIGSTPSSYSTFTIIITETNGVGGIANIRPDYPSAGSCGGALYNMKFDPFGSVSHLYGACANGRPTTMIIKVTGHDENGYTINTEVAWPFTWDN